MKNKLHELCVAILMPMMLMLFALTGALFAGPTARAEAGARVAASAAGVEISYQLPTDGPLPKTYRVTLAVTEASDPNWIVSMFLAGETRVVTAENQGKFTEIWNGLDDNSMPVPPGKYGVKGIVMPATIWNIDGKPHTMTAKYLGGPFALAPRADEDTQGPKVHGDPVGSPPGDVATAGNRAVFTWIYLENGRNNFLLDLTKPIGVNQIISCYNSGGAAGGPWSATDGKAIWSIATDGGQPFLYRADGPFGNQKARYRDHVVLCEGKVTGLAALEDATLKKTFVYLAEGDKLVVEGKDKKGRTKMGADDNEKINRVSVYDGQSAAVLATIALSDPGPLAARNGKLFTLQPVGQGWGVRSVALENGLPKGAWSAPILLKGLTAPSDLDVDSLGHIWITDPKTNHVFVFKADGSLENKLGKLDAQIPGKYDKLSFMSPTRVACVTDEKGADHAIVMENQGPGRFAQWAPDGKLVREWQGLIPHANNGYAQDPQHPEHMYIQGHGETLLRFVVDYSSGAWTLDAVWPNVTGDIGDMWRGEGSFPRIIYHDGKKFLAYGRGITIYRFDGDRCIPSAAMVRQINGKERKFFAWNDENGDGVMQDDEWKNHPIETPPRGVYNYHGDGWQEDFSLVCIGDGTRDIFRLAPARFDSFGNPVFEKWTTLLTDPTLTAKASGNATALHGGNELTTKFDTGSWARAVMAANGDLYTNARGGGFSANNGAEHKITRYVPDGKGGYQIRWRIGRSANIAPHPDAVVGSIHITEPMNGFIGVVDQSKAGVLVFTADEGLYVDTLLLDGSKQQDNVYGSPGEFFSGGAFENKNNGKVYLKWGKYTPFLFEVPGWVKNSGIAKITTLPAEINISASQIAAPALLALQVRGGAGKAPFARFQPSPGQPPMMDGSLIGWESCEAIPFADGDCKLEVRGMYDRENVYLNWQIHSDAKIHIAPLQPAERLFTHDRGADTFGLYFQGDPNATGKTVEGRAGDARFIFGLFSDGGVTKSAALAMYPKWDGKESPRAVTYGSLVGSAAMANVMLRPEIKMSHVLGADGKTLAMCAAIPRSVLPANTADWSGGLRTMVNFDANFGGNHKFWWSNADGTANRETNDEPTEARLYPGSWAPLELVPLSKGLFVRQWQIIGPFGFSKLATLDHRAGRPEICQTFANTKYPPEPVEDLKSATNGLLPGEVDLKAVYTGDIARTRKAARTLKWLPLNITTDDVEFRKTQALNWGMYEDEGVMYLVTWINAPADVAVKLNIPEIHGHRSLHGWLNGNALPVVLPPGKSARDLVCKLDPEKPITLKRGWNTLMIRMDYIWGEETLSARLEAPAATLWSLRVTNQQPEMGKK